MRCGFATFEQCSLARGYGTGWCVTSPYGGSVADADAAEGVPQSMSLRLAAGARKPGGGIRKGRGKD
jgi:hypothetical protein